MPLEGAVPGRTPRVGEFGEIHPKSALRQTSDKCTLSLVSFCGHRQQPHGKHVLVVLGGIAVVDRKRAKVWNGSAGFFGPRRRDPAQVIRDCLD